MVKAFMWSLVLNRLHTNDLLQASQYKDLSHDISAIHGLTAESRSQLFLHCPDAWRLWSRLFRIHGDDQVCQDPVLVLLLLHFYDLGETVIVGILQIATMIAILRGIRLKSQSRFSELVTFHILWEQIVFLASLWATSMGALGVYQFQIFIGIGMQLHIDGVCSESCDDSYQFLPNYFLFKKNIQACPIRSVTSGLQTIESGLFWLVQHLGCGSMLFDTHVTHLVLIAFV